MDENDTLEEVVESLVVMDNAQRDELLTQALYPWRVEQLREIQAAWNQRAGVANSWRLNEIVSVLISMEHNKMFPKPK